MRTERAADRRLALIPPGAAELPARGPGLDRNRTTQED